MRAPLIVWRCQKRCLLLEVSLDAEGWHLRGKPHRIHPQAWVEQMGYGEEHGLAARDRGEVALPNLRRRRALVEDLPTRLEEWPTSGGPDLACRHGRLVADVAALREDARKARDTPSDNWPVRRTLAVT